MKAPSKCCELDLIPTNLLKEVIHELSPILTDLINTSLQQGTFPMELKKALLWPLLKKATLDFMIKNNFRPISNLAFSGKLIENIVDDQIISHIDQHNLMEEKQSAYRKFHSTETALLKVKTDIIKAMDNQEITCLILLDLLAAFNTIGHTILLNRLETTFGIKGYSPELDCLLPNWQNPKGCNRWLWHWSGSNIWSCDLDLSCATREVLGPILFTPVYCATWQNLQETPYILPPVCRWHSIIPNL